MTFDSSTVVRQLQTLERQIADAARHDGALRMASTCGDQQAARDAIVRAERHVRAMAITTGHLKDHVVPADGLGVALESLSELVLRAARLVVFVELDTLRALVQTLPELGQRGRVAWGRFEGIDDLTDGVRAALDRETAAWRALRGRAQSERLAYRAALQAAHAALRHLGTASEFARFLWEGRNRADCPPLQETCSRMSIALTHRIDVEPDQPLVICASRAEDQATERAS